MILQKLGVYGWPERDENLLLASLLTGDPLLLIGKHGCAKTHCAVKLAQALGRKSLCYDASKCMFEDVLGYPNVEKLKQGIVEYIESPITIWDKELIIIDELNRAVPELQGKWLEIIRSRQIMGFATKVKWVWAAMNPHTYSGVNAMDEALIGRFATFLYPPDILGMEEEDRIKVCTHINGDDAPALGQWVDTVEVRSVSKDAVEKCGVELNLLLYDAARHFLMLRSELFQLSDFLARFALLLAQESKGQIELDGRRLGFLHRNMLAVRSIEVAQAQRYGEALLDFASSAKQTLLASIPIGLNADEGIAKEEAEHRINLCFDLLSAYFQPGAPMEQVNLVYELFTTKSVLRKAELLLAHDLGELAKCKAWNNLMDDKKEDLTVLAYTALLVEAKRPGTVPQELLLKLSNEIEASSLGGRCIPCLKNEGIEHIELVRALLVRKTDLERIVAYAQVSNLVESEQVTPERIEATGHAIEKEIEKLQAILGAEKSKGKAA